MDNCRERVRKTGYHGNLEEKDAINDVGSCGPVPRVATGIKDRVNRLKAIGNGQVPQVVATAFQALTNKPMG